MQAEPAGDSDQSRKANLSGCLLDNARHTDSCPAASTLAHNSPADRSLGQLVDVSATLKLTSAGFKDSD
jgi:hypothetical protein